MGRQDDGARRRARRRGRRAGLHRRAGRGYGGLWFYDVSDAEAPDEKGRFKLPQRYQYDLCTAHLFNVVPLRSERDILVASWYEAGTTVVDFTDPSKPKQLAFYNAAGPGRHPA